MIYAQIEAFTERLIGKTNQNEINWVSLGRDNYRDDGFPDLISQAQEALFLNEFRYLLFENSFYFLHNEGVVAFLRLDSISGKDGSHSDEYALLIQTKKNLPVQVLDSPTLQEKFAILYMAILDQQSANMNLSDDLYNFMQSL